MRISFSTNKIAAYTYTAAYGKIKLGRCIIA